MPDFFTWNSLSTSGGVLLATTMVTQLFKGTALFARIPTRIFSYFVALIVLVCHLFAAGAFAWSGLALCFLNAVLVSLAANGAYDGIASKKKI